MVYNYTRKSSRNDWDADAMKSAINSVKNGAMSAVQASKTFNIPRSTLLRRVKDSNKSVKGSSKMLGNRQTMLPEHVEGSLVQYLVDMEGGLFDLTPALVRKLAFDLAEANQIKHNFSLTKKSAGKAWFANFMKRHPNLSVKTREATSAGIARHVIESVYPMLRRDLVMSGTSTLAQKEHCESYLLQTDISQSTEEKLYKCNCGAEFALLTDLREHSLIHTAGTLGNHCEICGVHYRNLKLHICAPTGGELFKCDYCDAQFTKSYLLKKHVRTHTKGDLLKCHHCELSFTELSTFRQHMFASHREKLYKCDDCGLQFIRAYSLRQHSSHVHSKGSLHKCEHCGLEFAKSTYLNQHLALCQGEKPYKCQQCLSQFYTSRELRKHARTHIPAKRYLCEICGLLVSSCSTLKQHMHVHDGGTLKCDFCDSQFNYPRTLKCHLRVCQGDKPYICDQCGVQVNELSIFRQHLLAHSNG